ncbi:MAG: DUF362 domain-containing protein [Gemmataceae bacterium]|nr:DUF362 domain-containing protein [Gemmataceae bacterium]MDW8264146.1 DUF362 domain-containing protein [Gemmataceae bacterium]
MTAVMPILDRLASQAQPEGGWGYVPGQPPQLEPTCLVLLALAAEPERFAGVISRGQEFLRSSQAPDGSYRQRDGRDEAIWPTAQVLFTQAVLGEEAEGLRRTASFLLGVTGRVLPDDPEVQQILDIDHRLRGWPWAEGNFSWVEPTAWACLALSRAGWGDHPRVAEGRRLLLDRALDEGGMNYGSRHVFGGATEPQVGPTAAALLALQTAAADPRRTAAVDYLRREAERGDDLENLCWIRLALDLYPGAGEPAELDERISAAARARAERSWVRPVVTRDALLALALDCGRRNPFRLAASGPRDGSAPPPARLGRRRPGLIAWLGTKWRNVAAEALVRLKVLTPPAAVHIARAASYQDDLADVLSRQYAAFRDRVPLAGRRVVLKPNLVEYHRDRVINTHPHVVAAAIELCRREGAREIIVAEGPGHCRNTEYIVAASGLGDVLRHYRVPFVDLNLDKPVKRVNLGRLTGLDVLYFAETIVTADVLISLPKLKTHHWVGATLALKNLFGTLPGTCYGWPKNELHWRGIERSIIDIALTRPPDLAIVDGIVGMEGDGPLNGTAKPMGVLVMGQDPVAVDATCCRLMGLDPEKVGYLRLGAWRRLGLLAEAAIAQIGEPVASLARPFAVLPHFEELRLAQPQPTPQPVGESPA